MTKHKTGSLLRDQAKQCLSGKYFGAVMIQLLALSIQFFYTQSVLTLNVSVEQTLNRIMGVSQGNLVTTLVTYGISIFATSLSGVMSIGLTLYYLSLSSGNQSAQWDLFYGYRVQFEKSFTLSFLNSLINSLALVPLDLGISIFKREGRLSANTILILTVSQVICALVALYLTLSLSQIAFILLDYPELSAGKIIKMSFKIMKGHKLRLLFIRISFLPLLFFNIFTLGIGNLWIDSYRRTTYSMFYLDLMNPENCPTAESTSGIRS